MRVFVIDTSNMGPELQGGLIGVVGSVFPTAAEKKECVETVARYAADRWAVAGDPHTLIGRLAALTAETACVPFVSLSRLPRLRHATPTPTVPGGSMSELNWLPVVPPLRRDHRLRLGLLAQWPRRCRAPRRPHRR